MTKHTPAPWTRGKQKTTWYNIYADNERVRVARAFDPSPAPYHKAGGFEIEEANARLIAAAPELLEALKALVEFADAVGKLTKYSPNPRDIDAARAAIRKAEEG